MNEACAGPAQLADTAADTRVADILMGIKQGHVLGNTLILLCASIALSTWNIYHNLAKCQTKDNLSRYFMFAVCFSFSVSWLFFRCLTNIILYNLISSAPDLMKVEVFWFVVGIWSHKKFKTKIEFPYLHKLWKVEMLVTYPGFLECMNGLIIMLLYIIPGNFTNTARFCF